MKVSIHGGYPKHGWCMENLNLETDDDWGYVCNSRSLVVLGDGILDIRPDLLKEAALPSHAKMVMICSYVYIYIGL